MGRQSETGLGPYRFGIYFSFANAFVWMIGMGTPMILLAEHLGAGAFEVGLLYSAVFLFLPLQVLSTTLLPYLGFRRQLSGAWFLRTLCLFVPLGIALAAPETPAPVPMGWFIVAVFAFCFFRATGACALLPWLFAILPSGLRGRYFGTDSVVVGIAGIVTLLLGSALFGVLPPFSAFSLIFGAAIAASLISLWFLRRLPEGGRPEPVHPLRLARRALQLCTRPSHYQRFLWFQLLYATVGFAFIPFSTYYLKTTLDYSQSTVLGFNALQFTGMSAVGMVLRIWVDRVGAKPFFLLSHVATTAFLIFWLCLVAYPAVLAPFLAPAFVLVGVAQAMFMTATNKYIPQICRRREMALSASVLGALVGFFGGLAATAWGFLLKDEATGLIVRERFVLYFALAAAVQGFLLAAYLRLRDRRPGPEALPATGLWVRPFRFLVSVVNLAEPPPPMARGLRTVRTNRAHRPDG